MYQQKTQDNREFLVHVKKTSSLDSRLGDEEEAWYRHREDSIEEIRRWIRQCPERLAIHGSPLAEDEDEWARRW